MDGRDIGSVVLPDADLKFFLHADLSIRQQRRSSDGETDSISGRDKLDSTRRLLPLYVLLMQFQSIQDYIQ